MLRSRFNWMTAAAGSLSLLVLAGCPNAGTQPPVGASPSVAPTASGSPSGSSTTTPSASPSTGNNGGGSSASPSVVPSAPTNLAATTVSGKVNDEEGAAVSAAKVRVRSLNPSAPFDSTVDVVQGAYVVNGVPSGVQVEVSAFKDGWTSRARVTSLLPLGESRKNVVNFGSTDEGDAGGGAYFISDFPEIVSATADEATLKGEKVSYKITLSEALDSTNRNRFEDYVVISSDAAVPGFGAVEIADGSTFVDEDVQTTFSWDTEGKVLTVSFNAPLYTVEDDEFTYRFRLRRTATGDAIEDAAGNDLGFTTPAQGGFYAEAFRIANPTLASTDDTTAERWAAVHSGSASFDVAADEADPTLTGVTVTTPTVNAGTITRISLTFSEPMGAYAGSGKAILGMVGSTRLTEDGALTPAAAAQAFTFAVGKTAADLDDVSLDGESTVPTLASLLSGATFGDDSSEREKEFYINNATVSINPTDAKVVRLEVANKIFADDVNAIKARVEGLTDPAGNAITEASADANEKVGSI